MCKHVRMHIHKVAHLFGMRTCILICTGTSLPLSSKRPPAGGGLYTSSSGSSLDLQCVRQRSKSGSTMCQAAQSVRRHSMSDGSVCQTAQDVRQHNVSGSIGCQAAQYVRRHSMSDGTVCQAAQYVRQCSMTAAGGPFKRVPQRIAAIGFLVTDPCILAATVTHCIIAATVTYCIIATYVAAATL